MPRLPQPSGKLLAEPEEANPADWLSSPQAALLTIHTLYQRNGYAMTLLVAETDYDAADEGGEDACTRAARSAR